MNKILGFFIIILFFLIGTLSSGLHAQTTTADVFKAKKRIEFQGYKIEEVQNDTALPTNSSLKLPTEYAVKQFVLNHLGGGPGGAGNRLYILDELADTTGIAFPKDGDVAIIIDSSQIWELEDYWKYRTDIDLSDINELQHIVLTGDLSGDGQDTINAVINNGVVTNAKLANMASGKLKGRSTSGTGPPEDITVGTGLTLSGGILTASGGGPATAGGSPTEVQVNVGGVLGTGDSVVITQSPGDRLGIGKRTGLGARLHIQSQANDDKPALLIDNSDGKRVVNIRSDGNVELGGTEAEVSSGTLSLRRYTDGQVYAYLGNEENDSIFDIRANKNALKFLGKNQATGFMSDAGWKFKIGAYEGPHGSAVVDIDGIQSGGKVRGFLLPRGTTSQRNAIIDPAPLLMFGNTSTGRLQYYSGGWKTLADSASLSGNFLPIGGGTLTGHLLFSGDNTYDIGQVSAFRPRTIYTGTSFVTSGTGMYSFQGRSSITSPANGQVLLTNDAGTAFSRLMFGGTSNAYPALVRNGAGLDVQTANGANQGNLTVGLLAVGTTSVPTGSILADFQHTSKGIRPPQMSTTQRNAIASPAVGIIIGNITTGKPNWYNAVTAQWEEPSVAGSSVTSIVVGTGNTTKGLSAVESPPGVYTLGLNLGSLGVIDPVAKSDTNTYIVTQRAVGIENSKVLMKDIIYPAWGEAYTMTEQNLGVLTSSQEYDIKLPNSIDNMHCAYNVSTGEITYTGTEKKSFIARFDGTIHSAVIGQFWIKIYTKQPSASWVLNSMSKVYIPNIGDNVSLSCHRRVVMNPGAKAKVVIVQQPTGTTYIDMATFSLQGEIANIYD